ncbi:hypothetical protein [Xenorhabdus szentirmaii]|uniref:Uncharacterized protein n=1 Tax=Xenorhabdus szentirmaii TaxID=290112 RepID=A0AAW3Z1V8_9GAMM|nr:MULTISPECIES: hypothetical protein [Xenorhabdus]MBD2781828.1 hypothetical protein [Xenorhabdus sp. 38]MBD2802458.1 hypothetical protein [Xenorhabdus sp. M]
MNKEKRINFLNIDVLHIGEAKELYDSRPSGTGWSWHDIAYDIAGAITGYSLYQSMK